ncbi:MAG TPA: MFS transporter [Vicinamibacterales bacterium]|nr:MFS transporter [Vicinamibacterales bacterium]
MRGLRWWIIGLVFLATLINFIDRLTISILAPVITTDLKLSNTEFGSLTVWFLAAYTASQGLSGRLFDRVGTRRGFTISVLVWSAAATAHAFARSLRGLSVLRFVLGLGEAGNWPGAAKVIAQWFPARERAFAMGIFNSGVAIGNIVAPPLIVLLQIRYGWQAAFLVTGGLGFAWLLLWLMFYDSPDRHPSITPAERALIGAAGSRATAGAVPWRELLKFRQTWALVAARFVTDPVWWLYITWLPKYLADVRGFSLKEIGLFAWLPYVTADAGSLGGGWLSGHLIARGWSVDRARKTVIVIGALFMLGGNPAALAASAGWALAWIACVTFGFQTWINNVQTLPSDIFESRAVASVAGLGGVGAGLGAMLFTYTTGVVVDRMHSYTPMLVIAGILPIIGTVVLFAIGGPIVRSVIDVKPS